MTATIVKALRRMAPPGRIDLWKQFEYLYSATADASRLLEVPPLQYLMVDGAGDPNTSVEFQLAVESLYAMDYRLKSELRHGDPPCDYPVMPLEGLWWSDEPSGFDFARRETWKWTLMILVPDRAGLQQFRHAVAELGKKRPLAMLNRVRLESLWEGTCAQTLHVGPYPAEPGTIARLKAYIAERQCDPRGRHHEIYLNDPKRTPPEKLRTIIRQPVR